ncbi:MAG: HNH endonuclease [Candidatus Thorarchaeota archaeon]|nr:HNH endonuclease [Candidatus Thorarchaeota archaeon]
MGSKTYRDAHGYLRFIDSGKLVHRWAAQKKLGRSLNPGEIVHHNNRVRTDNRFGNLRVFKSKKEHQAHHIKERWERTRRKRTLKGR